MFEVVPQGNGFAWQMINWEGRVLVGPSRTFPCMLTASEAAKAYRALFWAIADQIDHRMGRCI